MSDLTELDATAQAELVASGGASPAELVDAAIARVERTNGALNAVIHERFDRARRDALDPPVGPFRGVPIVIKDLDGPLAGEPYHLGNRLLKQLGHIADHDSFLNAKLRAAGFIVIGKTNAPELGLLPTTEPAAYGPTRNPWDTDPVSGRFEWWHRRGRRIGDGAARARGRRRRLDSNPREHVRARRAEAVARTDLARARRR